MALGDLDLPFAEELARLAPFGAANREPLFALRGVTTRATRVVGKGHLQLTLDHGGTVSEAIAFGFGAHDPGPGAVLDLVATAELDTYRGARRTRLQGDQTRPPAERRLRSARLAVRSRRLIEQLERPRRRRNEAFWQLLPRRNLRRALLLIIAIVAVIAIKRSGGLSLDKIFQQVAPAVPTAASVPSGGFQHLEVRPARRPPRLATEMR